MHKKYEVHASPDRCKKSGVSLHIDGFRCPASRHQCRNCHKYGHLVACATRRKTSLTRKGLCSPDHPKHINFRLVQFVCKILYAASQKIYPQVKIHSACKCN